MAENGDKPTGRLHYFEPSMNAFENNEGTNSDSITFPYDRYNIAVDLRVFVNDRYSCGLSNETNERTEYAFSTSAGTISFLGGTNGYLTTNYTDIQNITPQQNTQECLGIESINISYEAWLHPTVVVKFVDIRGATVMQPADQNYYNEGNQGYSYKLYKSLFTFPYPLFILKVKGFYGKGVTYRLAVNKVDIDFDGKNGNFVITVNFIGHIYGLFADIPISYLAVAPYTEEGDKYWRQRTEDSDTFWFHRVDSDGNEYPETPMLKLPELAKKVAEVECAQNIINSESESHQTMQDLTSQKEMLSNIVSDYNSLFNNENLKGFMYRENDTMYTDYSYIFLHGTYDLSESDTVSGIYEKFKYFSDALDAYDSAFTINGSLKSKFIGLDDWTQHSGDYWLFSKVPLSGYSQQMGVKYNDEYKFVCTSRVGQAGCGPAYEKIYCHDCLKEFIESGNIGEYAENIKVYIRSRNGGKKYGEIIEELNEKIAKIDAKLEELNEGVNKENESIIEQALGFVPSIKNMFDLMFAHLETFIHVFYAHLKKIKEELKNNDEKRKKTFYEITDEFTDTEPSGKGMRGDFLPPFTAFYEEWKDEASSGDNVRKKEMWPGNITHGNPEENLDEIKFVYDLLSGSKLYFDEVQSAQKTIEEYRQNGTNINFLETGPSYDTSNFIPITIYDIANNGHVANPYESVAQKIKSNANINEIAGDIYTIFSMRLFYYMVSNAWNNKQKNTAKTFGRIEAINFYKAVGVVNSPSFVRFVKAYADSNYDEDDDFLNQVTNPVNNSELSLSWRVKNSPNTRPNLFAISDSDVYYSYSKPDTNGLIYLPLHISSTNELKSDFSNNSLNENERYISTTKHDSLQSNTFKLYEDGTYITNLLNNVNAELVREKNESDDENVKDLLNVEDYDIRRASSTFEMFANDINGNCNRAVNSSMFRTYNEEKQRFDEVNDAVIDGILQSGSFRDENIYVRMPVGGGDLSRYENNPQNTVFDSDNYRLQTNITAKAYLFLNSIPLSFNDINLGRGGILEKTNTVAQKVSLLKEGSLYWYIENRDTAFKQSGTVEPYVYSLDSQRRPITKEAHQASVFLLSVNDTEFFVNFNYGTDNTVNKSKSRVSVLKKYFENWANSDFANNVSLLEDLTLRKPYKAGWTYRYVDDLDLDIVRKTASIDSPTVKKAQDLQKFLKDLLLNVDTIFDYYGGFHNKEMNVSKKRFKFGFEEFMVQLNKIYGKISDASLNELDRAFMENASVQAVEDPFKSNDLRLSTYMTLKSLYDKWICGSLKGEDSWKLNTSPSMSSKKGNFNYGNNGGDSGLYELDNFIYVDSLYRDIGHRLKVNLTKFTTWINNTVPSASINGTEGIMNYNSKSLYEFLTELAQDCGGYILAIPQRFMYNNVNDIKTVFTPISSCDQWDDNCYTYMFLYNYRPSEHLGDTDTRNIDMNGWSPDGDGYNLTDSDIVGSLFSDDNGYGVPAFGVTFGKGNQSYFKDIKLSTGQFGVTEAGLNATFQIASKGSETIRQTTLYGQDIYKVYSNNAYECTVEMMGDMQIFPPMYFQLNNIPMWKGAYMIKKVTHVITPGNATTTIVGVRQNKYLIPFTNGDIVSFVGEKGGTVNTDSSVSNLSVGDVPYNGGPDKNISGNRSSQIKEDEGLSEDITPTKPIIILTPGHSTKSDKPQEHSWATRLIKDYIIPKLKLQKFKDGSSYADHVVQGGKKDMPNSESSSYDFWPVRNLVDKYGSKCVISVNVHWNGDGGQYFAAFWAHETAGGEVLMRSDSQAFGMYMREAFKEVVAKKDTYSKMPVGMMDLGVPTWHYALKANNTDPGAGWAKNPTHCACVLTENFFPNFYPKNTTKINWKAQNWNEIDQATGRYCNGRGWLESDEGCNVIANAHVNAIINYVNSLVEGNNSVSESVTNIGSYDINRACEYITSHIHPLRNHDNDVHDCAKHVRLAIEAGYNNANSTKGHPVPAKDYHNKGFLPKIGFYKVTAFTNSEISTSGYVPVKGDIAVYEKPNHPTEAGHICMYNGSGWYSYWAQSSIYCYNSINGTTTINVYRIQNA